jgi:hypothetical protein
VTYAVLWCNTSHSQAPHVCAVVRSHGNTGNVRFITTLTGGSEPFTEATVRDAAQWAVRFGLDRAWVVTEGHSTRTIPQPALCSPILANVYLHHALDVWFENIVRLQGQGSAYLCRYADDFVCVFEDESDARRFYQVLPERLARYGLEIAAEKTNLIRFDQAAKTHFDFLGFEFRWGLNRWRRPVLKRRTARNKYRASIASFRQWFQTYCSLPKAELFAKLNVKLRGYWNYYGIRGNYESLSDYLYQITRELFKGFNRRSQRKSYTWAGFRALLDQYPLIKPRICHAF